MQESEARAYFLRDMRKSNGLVQEFYKSSHEFGSKKHVQQFLSEFRQAHSGITIFEYKKPTRHAWHFQHTFFYIEPKTLQEDGIGKLLMVQQTTLDSKKLIKNDLNELLAVNVTKDLLIHEHFFTRLIQRASLSGLKEALHITARSLAEILNHIKFEVIKFEPGQTVHLVFPDKVFIATCQTESAVLIFKTVILPHFMTSKQTRTYQQAIADAAKQTKGFVSLLEDNQKFEQIF